MKVGDRVRVSFEGTVTSVGHSGIAIISRKFQETTFINGIPEKECTVIEKPLAVGDFVRKSTWSKNMHLRILAIDGYYFWGVNQNNIHTTCSIEGYVRYEPEDDGE